MKTNSIINAIMSIVGIVQQKMNRVVYFEHSLIDFSYRIMIIINVNTNKKLVIYNTIEIGKSLFYFKVLQNIFCVLLIFYFLSQDLCSNFLRLNHLCYLQTI